MRKLQISLSRLGLFFREEFNKILETAWEYGLGEGVAKGT